MSETPVVVPQNVAPFDAAAAGKASHALTQKSAREVAALALVQKRAEDMAGSTTARATAEPNDPVGALMAAGQVIEPPFDLLTLSMLPEQSGVLGSCVDAMATNIDGFGYRLVPRIKTSGEEWDKAPDALKKAVNAERVRLQNFFMYASLEDSFTEMRRKLRKDLETTGNGYLEVIRDAGGNVQGFQHVPSYQIRLARTEDKPFKVETNVLKLQDDNSVKVDKVTHWKRFRRFVQSRTVHNRQLSAVGGYKTVWFKEWGDPRVYDNKTGEMAKDELAAVKIPEYERANELIHFKLYSSRSPYGLPRYIGNLLSVFGTRASEEINYTTFKSNNIPSMLILVAGGQLTQGSIDRITNFTESQIQGSDNYSKFLLLEAEGEEESDDGGQIKLDVKPLVKEQHKDALFQNYAEKNEERVRISFRIAPLFLGKADDYTRATAETTKKVTDEQVFAPERDEFDTWVNRILFAEMEVIYHKFKSNTPNTTDNTELVAILANSEKTGGLTPRIARIFLQDIFGAELPDFPPDFPADVPFSMTMAEAVKNQADPTQPGQQVTALKMMHDFTTTVISEYAKGDTETELVAKFVRLQKNLEKKFAEKLEDLEDASARAQADHEVEQG